MNAVLKRLFDVLASAFGLVILAPLFVVIAILIRLGDQGPVFFRQDRVGHRGRIFRIHKFRTMRVANSGSLVTQSNDDRITPLGGFLRRWKLDELPQLIDVLKGDMSIVGPRPEVPKYVALWDPAARDEILRFRPGISDPAAIAFRDEQEQLSAVDDPESHYVEVILPAKVSMYLDYVRHQSFIGDLKLILGTFVAIAR